MNGAPYAWIAWLILWSRPAVLPQQSWQEGCKQLGLPLQLGCSLVLGILSQLARVLTACEVLSC